MVEGIQSAVDLSIYSANSSLDLGDLQQQVQRVQRPHAASEDDVRLLREDESKEELIVLEERTPVAQVTPLGLPEHMTNDDKENKDELKAQNNSKQKEEDDEKTKTAAMKTTFREMQVLNYFFYFYFKKGEGEKVVWLLAFFLLLPKNTVLITGGGGGVPFNKFVSFLFFFILCKNQSFWKAPFFFFLNCFSLKTFTIKK